MSASTHDRSRARRGRHARPGRTGRRLAVVGALLAGAVAAPAPALAGHGSAVGVDVRPGTAGAAVLTMQGKGVVPVAVLSTPSFDATRLDVSSICFGDPDNALQRDCTEAHRKGHREDVDGDRDADLLLHFQPSETGLDGDDTQACLEARSADGSRRYFGCDAVRVKKAPLEQELPDLSVALTANPTTADAGARATWTAVVTNDGPGGVTVQPGTRLLDWEVPSALGSTAVTAPHGHACATATAGFRCTADEPDTLAPGETRAFVLTGLLPTVPGPVEVGVTADPASRVTELDELDNAARAAVVVRAANLTASLLTTTPTVAPGGALEWRARVANPGPGAAPVPAGAALLRLVLPSSVALAAEPAPGLSCSATSTGYDCALAGTALAAGSDLLVVLRGTAPPTAGPLLVRAVADPAGVVPETDEADNAAEATALVALPNLFAAVVAASEEPAAGDPTVWTATVTNAGPTEAAVPAGAELVRLTTSTELAGAVLTPPSGYACTATAPTAYACTATAPDALVAGSDRVFRLAAPAPSASSVTVTATADPTGAVAESDESDNAASRTTSVVLPARDLSIALTGTPDPVDAVATSTWLARIRNDAGPVDVPSGTSLVRFAVPAGMTNLAVSTPAGYSCFIVAAGVVDCATTAATTLPAGGVVEVTFFGTTPRQPGPLSMTAQVDPLDAIAESDESDNSATDTITVQPPDLSMALSGSPDPADAVSSTTWTATITNDGPSNARIPTGTQVIRLLLDAGFTNLAVSTPAGYTCFLEAADTVGCQTTATTNVAAGATIPITLFATTPRQPGPMSVTATADPNNAVPEGDETDNSATDTITVQPPDFAMTLVGAPDPADAASSSTWTATLSNLGPSNARLPISTRVIRFALDPGFTNLAVSTPAGYTCFIEAANTVDCQTTGTTNLAAGSSLVITFFATTPRTPGPISMTAAADPLDAVPEGDETNNSATDTIAVQPPDLSMALSGSPDPADAVATSTWNATITNDGPSNARIPTGTQVIRLLLDAGFTNLAVSTPAGYTCFLEAANTVACQTTATTNVPAGGTIPITLFATTPRQPGPVSVTATADPNNAIPEGDETDNSATDTITVQPPDLSTALAPASPTVAAGASTSWAATVTNDGPANARVTSGTRVLRFEVPSSVTNLAVSAPAGYSCFLASAGVVDCQVTATTNVPAGGTVSMTLFGKVPSTPGTVSVTATADPGGAIPEADETDNSATAAVTVT